jgi:hypothetical protein
MVPWMPPSCGAGPTSVSLGLLQSPLDKLKVGWMTGLDRSSPVQSRLFAIKPFVLAIWPVASLEDPIKSQAVPTRLLAIC